MFFTHQLHGCPATKRLFTVHWWTDLTSSIHGKFHQQIHAVFSGVFQVTNRVSLWLWAALCEQQCFAQELDRSKKDLDHRLENLVIFEDEASIFEWYPILNNWMTLGPVTQVPPSGKIAANLGGSRDTLVMFEDTLSVNLSNTVSSCLFLWFDWKLRYSNWMERINGN